MAAEIGNRLPENSKLLDAWTRRGEHGRARSSRPSNLFRLASVFPSCRTLCADAGEARTAFRLRGHASTALCRRYFVKNRDEHWRDILQEILRFGALENGGVLPQFVGDLVNDELASLLKRIVRFSQQGTLLVDLENAERDAGEDVIARSETMAFQLVRQRGCIAMDHMDARINGKCSSSARASAASSSNKSNSESGVIRRAISREWTPSPGPYSAITRGSVKSILLATRSTSAFELGTIDAI